MEAPNLPTSDRRRFILVWARRERSAPDALVVEVSCLVWCIAPCSYSRRKSLMPQLLLPAAMVGRVSTSAPDRVIVLCRGVHQRQSRCALAPHVSKAMDHCTACYDLAPEPGQMVTVRQCPIKLFSKVG